MSELLPALCPHGQLPDSCRLCALLPAVPQQSGHAPAGAAPGAWDGPGGSPSGGAGDGDGRWDGHGAGEGPLAWPAPLPLLPDRADAPAFPLHVLPPVLTAQVASVSAVTQTDPALAAVMGLAALSAALRGRLLLRVRPGWRELLTLWLLVAAHVGERKSAVVAAMTGGLLDAERDLAAAALPGWAEYQAQLAAARTRRQQLERKASGADPAATAELASAVAAEQRLLDAPPVLPRLVVQDATPEALAQLLARDALAVLSPEGGLLQSLVGLRYGQGGPNVDALLHAHVGEPFTVDRKGQAPLRVEHPALTLGLATQPAVLAELLGHVGLQQRGLPARIAACRPASLVGVRPFATPAPDVPAEQAWERLLRQLATTCQELRPRTLLHVHPDALPLLAARHARLEPELQPGGAYAHLYGWAEKSQGLAARLAGVLHVAGHAAADPAAGPDAWRVPIGRDAMAAGIAVADYFTAHQVLLHDRATLPAQVADALHVLGFLRRKQLREWAWVDVRRGLSWPADQLAAAVQLLAEHGLVRRIDQPTGRRGRPSPVGATHPDVFAPAGLDALITGATA